MKNRLEHPDAEYALLARLIIDPDQLPEAVGRLAPGDFSVADYAKVFEFVASRFTASEPIDSVVVKAATGISFDPTNLPAGATGPIEGYITSIRDAAVRRDVIGILDRARTRITSKDDEPISVVESAIDQIVQTSKAGTLTVEQAIDAYHEAVKLRGTEPAGMPYGIPKLDEILMPAKAGRLIMIAARPSVGKTALAEWIVDNWAKNGPVLFASLEMDSEELLDRAISRDSGIPLEPIIKGQVKHEDLAQYIEQRRQVPIIYDTKSSTMSAIRASAARTKLANGGRLAAVVIDYMQLLGDKDGGDNEVYRIANISHAAKRMARALGCPVLGLVQFSRAIESSDKPRPPRLSDMRDSGALEQDADVVIALVGDPQRSLREAHILKQRQGRVGKVTLWFHGETQKWTDTQEGQLEW